MFKKLKENIGKNVIIKYWKNNRIVIEELKLKGIKDYYYMLFDENYYIYNGAVISIIGENQEFLYNCENLGNKFGVKKDLYVRKNDLIVEGVKILKPELILDWIKYVNIKYGFKTRIIEIVLDILKNYIIEGQELGEELLLEYEGRLTLSDQEEVLEDLTYFSHALKELENRENTEIIKKRKVIINEEIA